VLNALTPRPLCAQETVTSEPPPESEEQADLRDAVASQPIGNDLDEPPASAAFGDVITQPDASYAPGHTLAVSVWTGHPDNAPPGDAPYFEVQRSAGGAWVTVATEADWSTQARWTQASRVIPPYDPLDPFAAPPPPINEAFTVSIDWKIPNDIEAGTYRVLFHGTHKAAGSDSQAFLAETAAFEIIRP
jgi:neutral ceramidase